MTNEITVVLPDIGEGVAEGEIIQWLKKEGEAVGVDEPVVVVMTDKATVELPSPHAGTLAKQHYTVGAIVPVGKPLYDLSLLVEATPATRAFAKELGVDLAEVQGTGKGARITESDVVRFHAKTNRDVPPPLHLPDDVVEPIVGIRHQIADKMIESKRNAAHFSFFDRADCTRLMQMKEKIQQQAEKEGVRLTYMPFFIRALSLTLKKYPQANASKDLSTNALLLHQHHHVGIAVKTDLGLIVAVIRDVQNKKLETLIREYDALIARAKEGKLTREEMINSTITISNFGPLGGLWATPVINYPEVAILGIAQIRREAVVKEEEIVIRPLVNLSWSFDHCVIDGHLAAAISNEFIANLENPVALL